MKKSSRKWLVIGAVVIVCAAGAVALKARGKDAGPPKTETPVGKAVIGDVQVEVTEVGTVEPEVKVDVKSVLSGKVVLLPIREGDIVRKGQLIASIEPDVNQAQTLAGVRRSVNQAEIDLSDAEKDFRAKEELLKAGLVSAEIHRAAETRYKASLETMESAEEKASLLRASGIPVDPNLSQVLNITSPMDGVVIQRQVELGDVATGAGSFNAGTIIATVADISKMIVKVGVNEVDIGKVSLDAPVTVTLDAFPKMRFEGKVSRIAPAARLQDQVKVFDTEISLDSQGKELRTGMTANVSIKGERANGVLTVPIEAVFHRESGEVVYLKKPAPAKGEKGEKAEEAETVAEGTQAGDDTDKKPAGGADPKATPDPREAWKIHFEEHPVVTGLASISSAQVLDGLKEGDEVALEDPTKPKKTEDDR